MSKRFFALTISTLALATLVATPANARPSAVRPWVQQSPIPTSNTLWGVDFLSATEAWAVGDYGSIVHTVDGGVSWQSQKSNTVAQLSDVEFADPLHGWAAGGSVYYTVDGGTTWHKGSGQQMLTNRVGFKDLTTGFATWKGSKGMFKTTDGGATWSKIQTQIAVGDVQFFDSMNGVISGPGGVMHTYDGGETWAVVPGGHGGFFIDHDEGWYALNDVVEHTTDGGETWKSQSLPGQMWVQSGASFADAQHGWVAGEAQGIAHTSDGGHTWTQQFGAGGSFYDHYRLWGIDFADGLHGAAIGEGGSIFTTSDGGTTWRAGLNGSGTETLDLDATDANHAWASQVFGEVLYTTDSGAHWIRTNPSHSFTLMHGIDFIDNSTGWVVGEDYGSEYNAIVYKSTDGGKTWTFQWSGGYVSGLFDVAAVDAQTVVAVGYQGIYRSTDGGATWDLILPTSGVMAGVKFYGSTGWAVGTNLIYKSTDGGATWKLQRPNMPFEEPFNDVSFAPDLQNGWAVGFYGVVLHTTDGGTHWVKQKPRVSQTTVSSVSAVSATRAWITGGSGPFGGAPFVKHTTDGGLTWVSDQLKMDTRNSVAASAFLSPTYGWVGGSVISPGGGIWRYSV